MVFDRDDLQRVRIAATPDPMWEVVLSLHRMREQRLQARYLPWRQHAHRRIQHHDRAKPWLHTLFTLVPPRGQFPDFLTPAQPLTDIDHGCESVACTRRDLLRSDLGAVFAGQATPAWVRTLATGDRQQLQAVIAAFRGAYDLLVAPHWHALRATVAAERAKRTRLLSDHGISQLLKDIPGVTRWDGRVLEMSYPQCRTVDLAGRGLTLVPSYFCTRHPVTLIDAELPPVLVYPIDTHHDGSTPPRLTTAHLAPLLGRTRAECLAALATPRTTSALASQIATSIATASRHAATLRQAGLIVSERDGSAVLHHLTPLGSALLTGVTAK